MKLKEIVEKFIEDSFHPSIHYKEGWFISKVKPEQNGYSITVKKWVSKVNESIIGTFYCSSSLIEEDDGAILNILNEKLKQELEKKL